MAAAEGADRDAEPRQRLRHLDADGAQAHHRDARWQRLPLEQRVGGEQALPQRLPGRRHHRAGAGGEDDGARGYLAAIHCQPAGAEQARAAADGALAEVVGGLQGALDEAVAQPPHAAQHGRQVDGECAGTANAEFLEGVVPVVGVGGLDQHLRGHAADAGAGGAPGAVVDQQEILRALPHLAQRGETGAAGADDDHFVVCVHGVFSSCLQACLHLNPGE